MTELDQAVVAAQLAPEWLYQRAIEAMIAEDHRVAECIRMGVMGYRTGVNNDRQHFEPSIKVDQGEGRGDQESLGADPGGEKE